MKQIKFYALIALAFLIILWLWSERKAQYQAGWDAAVVQTAKEQQAVTDVVNKRLIEHVKKADRWRNEYERAENLLLQAKKSSCWTTVVPGDDYAKRRLLDEEYRRNLRDRKPAGT